MCANGGSFEEIARDVVRSYIRSALLIDEEYPKPGGASKTDTGDDELFGELRDAVIRGEVLFSGLRYTDALKDAAKALARKADLLILDWDLVHDDGATALEILESLLDRGLTFVCIYTGQVRTAEARERILDKLGAKDAAEDPEPDFFCKNMLFCIYNKRGRKLGDGRELEPAHLLDTVIDAFSRKYCGYTQLALMELTTIHRETLPQMLDRDDLDFDAALLAEAANENSPVDVDGRAIRQVLTDDWRVQLERSASEQGMKILGKRGFLAFADSLTRKIPTDWHGKAMSCLEPLLESVAPELQSKIEALKEDNGPDLLRTWLGSGLSVDTLPHPKGIDWSKNEKVWLRVCFAYPLLHDYGTPIQPQLPLMKLDKFFHQSELPTMLTQGTILKADGKDMFFICITALCDAARPQTIDWTYTFVVGEKVQTRKRDRSNPYIVIHPENEGQPILIRIDTKKTVTWQIHDSSISKTSRIQVASASLDDDKKEYKLDRLTLIPAAQLRRDVALHLTSSYTSYASRVGLDRVEAIRLLYE